MAFRVYIPGICRLVFIRTPDEVRAVNDAAVTTRSLSGRGGLVNRAMAARLRVFRTPAGDLWPAFRDRLDPLRAERQSEVEAALGDVRDLLTRLAPEIAALAAYVCTGRSLRTPGIVVQQAVGRMFFPDYTASEESYDAARTLQTWLSAGPLRAYRLKRSGALRAALDHIMGLARGNTSCAHATALAIENIVKSVELMRKLALSGDNLKELGPEDAVARTLRGPARVIREVRDGARIGNVRLRARSLVVLGVEAARRQSPYPGIDFFAVAWNRCPAQSMVPALLGEVWQEAQNSEVRSLGGPSDGTRAVQV
jgi:hypothetical protein